MSKQRHCPMQTPKETIAVYGDQKIRFHIITDPGSLSPSHWHEAIEVIYILEGSADFTFFGQTATLEPGQFILINSGLVHASRCPSSGNRTILMQIPDEFLASYLPDLPQLWFSIDFNSKDPRVQADIQSLRELLLSMMELHESGKEGYLLPFYEKLFAFLDILYRKFRRAMPAEFQSKNSQILSRLESVLIYTRQNYASPIPLKKAADVAALQPEYFCRFFRKNMGMTYMQYLNDYRLSKIYRDLISTDLSVRDLEEKHGFTNDKLFHRLFRERFHTTPLQVRKTAQDNFSASIAEQP